MRQKAIISRRDFVADPVNCELSCLSSSSFDLGAFGLGLLSLDTERNVHGTR